MPGWNSSSPSPAEHAVRAGERAQLERAASRAGEHRRTLLRTALDMEDSYRRALGEVDFAAQRLRDVVHSPTGTCRSACCGCAASPAQGTVLRLAAPSCLVAWRRATGPRWGETLTGGGHALPELWLGLIAVAMLLWRSAPLKRAIRASAEPLRRISTDRFRYTLAALGLTLLAAAALAAADAHLRHGAEQARRRYLHQGDGRWP
jgi:potassium efflux system protein